MLTIVTKWWLIPYALDVDKNDVVRKTVRFFENKLNENTYTQLLELSVCNSVGHENRRNIQSHLSQNNWSKTKANRAPGGRSGGSSCHGTSSSSSSRWRALHLRVDVVLKIDQIAQSRRRNQNRPTATSWHSFSAVFAYSRITALIDYLHARFYLGAGGSCPHPNLSLAPASPQIFGYSSSMQ